MAWIESHQALLTHRKTGRLARALSISKVTAIGHLHAFWWWCLDNTEDGELRHIDDEDLADGAMWEDDPKVFLGALIASGFVDTDANGTKVHDWNDYAGKLIERRIRNRNAMRATRVKHVLNTNDTRVDDVSKCVDLPNSTQHNSTQPNPTEQDSTKDKDVVASQPKVKPQRLVIPPLLEWCQEYALKMNYPHDTAEAFYDHYAGLGWKRGKVLMVDWEASMRTWARNGPSFSNGPPRNINGRKPETLEEQSLEIFKTLYGEPE